MTPPPGNHDKVVEVDWAVEPSAGEKLDAHEGNANVVYELIIQPVEEPLEFLGTICQ